MRSKVNEIYFDYTIKLSLYNRKININILKINKFYLDTFRIVITDFLIKNLQEKIFLLANIKIKMVLEMFFLTHNNINI